MEDGRGERGLVAGVAVNKTNITLLDMVGAYRYNNRRVCVDQMNTPDLDAEAR